MNIRNLYAFIRVYQKTRDYLDQREEKKITSRKSPSGSFFRDTFDPFPAREIRELKQKYHTLKALHREAFDGISLPDLAVAIASEAYDDAGRKRNGHLINQTFALTLELLKYDGLFDFPEVDFSKEMNAEETVELRRILNRFEYFLQDFWPHYTQYGALLMNNLASVLDYIPDPPDDTDQPNDFLIPMLDVMTKPVEVIDRLVITVLSRTEEDAKLFHPKWKSIIERNVTRISDKELVLPSETQKDIHDLIELYLSGTPYRDIFYTTFPYSFPEALRFEHLMAVGGTGWGKTWLLKHLISKDKHGIIVMDSQGVLIRELTRIKWDREVILVDPSDVDWPVAFSLFSVSFSGSKAEREAILNKAVAMYTYLFNDLLGAGLTSRQETMFSYVARLMIEIPDATIYTLKDVFTEGEKFQAYIDRLDKVEQEYFAEQFFSKDLAPVKKQIITRIYGIMRDPTFRRLFAQTENKFNLFEAMQDGKIILINTAKSFLSGELYKLYGKFWIATVALATLKREFVKGNPTPVMFYIDEIREYMGEPRYLEDLITQARKYHVGLNMFFQDTSQMGLLRQTIMGSVRIKFAGGIGDADRRRLSGELDCTEEDLKALRKTDFKGSEWMVGVRNDIHFKTWIDYGALSDREHYTDEEYGAFIDEFHQKYCNRDEEPQPELQPKAKDEAKITVEEEHENANKEPEQKSSLRPQLPPAEVDYWKDL